MQLPRLLKRDNITDGITDDIKISEILGLLHHRAYGAVLVLFALPNCFLMPPVMSSIAGLPLILFGIQLTCGSPSPWLPAVLTRRRLSLRAVRMVDKTLTRLESLCRERWRMLTDAGGKRVIGVLVSLLALSIAIPLPFTNFLPGLAIAVIGLGMLNRDGAAILIGATIGSCGLLMTFTILASLKYLTGLLIS